MANAITPTAIAESTVLQVDKSPLYKRARSPVCDFDAFNELHDKHTFVHHARLYLGDHHSALHMRAFAVEVGLTPSGVGSLVLKVQLLSQAHNLQSIQPFSSSKYTV